MKQMTKAKIIAEASENSVLRERIFLAKMHSPFIVNMLCSFQNQYNLFLIMELLTGGDLRYHLINYGFFFTELQLKFLLSNIILGLEYIHQKGIVHRDLKPENVIFNSQGYLKITDFGISSLKKKLDKKDDSGTPAYMAPETIKGEDQDYSVDYYSLGVIGYEIMKGSVPYDANEREIVRKMMKKDPIHLTKSDELRTSYSEFCLDFINKLLRQDPEERLGYHNGEQELKAHSFFSGLDWEKIQKMKYQSPIFDIIRYSKMKHGNTKELFDFDYCNKSDGLTPESAKLYINITKSLDYQMYFRYYTCVCMENIMREIKEEEKRKKKTKKKMRRSKSMNEITSDYMNSNRRSQEYNYNESNDFNLPYIFNNNNPTEIYKRRERKLKNYYENKLLNYEDYLAKLNYDYELRKSQLRQMKYPSLFPQNIPPYYNNQFFPNYSQSFEQSFLPMINQHYNNYMNKIMSNFYKQMNENRDNFFAKDKYNMFNNNPKRDYDDYSNNDFYREQLGYQYNNIPPYFNNPYYPYMNNNFYNNPFMNEQRMKEGQKNKNESTKRSKERERYHTKRRSKITKYEENSTKKSQKEDKK